MTDEAPRVTGWRALDRTIDDIAHIPPGSLARRIGIALLLGIGFTMTAFGSIFLQNTGPIPFRIIPDIRPVLTMTTGILAGLWAAGGGAGRRKFALWTAITYVLAFHLEEATVHWIGPFPGSITGTRAGWLGTAGSLLALASVLLMHVEVEHARLGRDLERRGAGSADARGAAGALARAGSGRIFGILAGVAGIGVLVRGVEAATGEDASGGVYVLFLGGGLLLVLALILVRMVPRNS